MIQANSKGWIKASIRNSRKMKKAGQERKYNLICDSEVDIMYIITKM